MSRNITIEEITELSKKMWASTKDIQAIGCIGYDAANKIRKEIRDKLVDEGWILPKFKVPMEYVIKKFPSIEKRLKSQGGVANAG